MDQAATEVDFSRGREQVIGVQEYAEEAHVMEEARVGKKVSEHTETVRGSERHTEVKAEHLENGGRHLRATHASNQILFGWKG